MGGHTRIGTVALAGPLLVEAKGGLAQAVAANRARATDALVGHTILRIGCELRHTKKTGRALKFPNRESRDQDARARRAKRTSAKARTSLVVILLHNRQHLPNAFLRVRVDEIEIAAFDRGELRHQALVGPVRIDNVAALGGLPKDLGQAHDGHRTRCYDVRRYLSWPDRGQLVDIADKEQCGLVR